MATHLSIPSTVWMCVVMFSNQHLYYFYDKSTLGMLKTSDEWRTKACQRNWMERGRFSMIFYDFSRPDVDWCVQEARKNVLYERRETCDVWQVGHDSKEEKRNGKYHKITAFFFPSRSSDKWKSFIRPRHQLGRWKQTIRCNQGAQLRRAQKQEMLGNVQTDIWLFSPLQ